MLVQPRLLELVIEAVNLRADVLIGYCKNVKLLTADPPSWKGDMLRLTFSLRNMAVRPVFRREGEAVIFKRTGPN